jgi:hypothetical protein
MGKTLFYLSTWGIKAAIGAILVTIVVEESLVILRVRRQDRARTPAHAAPSRSVKERAG